MPKKAKKRRRWTKTDVRKLKALAVSGTSHGIIIITDALRSQKPQMVQPRVQSVLNVAMASAPED